MNPPAQNLVNLAIFTAGKNLRRWASIVGTGNVDIHHRHCEAVIKQLILIDVGKMRGWASIAAVLKVRLWSAIAAIAELSKIYDYLHSGLWRWTSIVDKLPYLFADGRPSPPM